MNIESPFEVVTESGGRAMLAFILPSGAFAWPWHSLKALRLSSQADTLFFDFAGHSVEVIGNNLGMLADLACAMRVKVIRTGRSEQGIISMIRILGDEPHAG